MTHVKERPDRACESPSGRGAFHCTGKSYPGRACGFNGSELAKIRRLLRKAEHEGRALHAAFYRRSLLAMGGV